jgi:hypothetical protein
VIIAGYSNGDLIAVNVFFYDYGLMIPAQQSTGGSQSLAGRIGA